MFWITLICYAYFAFFGALIIVPIFLYYAGLSASKQEEDRDREYQERLANQKKEREEARKKELEEIGLRAREGYIKHLEYLIERYGVEAVV